MIPRYWLAIGAAILLAAAVGWTFKAGYDAGYASATTRYEATMAEQAAANRRAINAANQDLLRAADALDAKSQELDDVLKSIDQAADADPDGGAIGLAADSVRRLDAIR